MSDTLSHARRRSLAHFPHHAEFVDSFQTLPSWPRRDHFRFGADETRNKYYRATHDIAKILPNTSSPSSPAAAGHHGSRQRASQGGGKSVGLNIELPHEQAATVSPTSRCTSTTFSRAKSALPNTASASFTCPGFGTLDEFFEIMTLVQPSASRNSAHPLWQRILEGLLH